MPDEEYVSLSGFHRWTTKGEIVEGILMVTDTIPIHYKGAPRKLVQFHILTNDGVTRLNYYKQLEMLKLCPPGTGVQIEYLGEDEHSKGLKLFDVRVKRSDFLLAQPKMLEAAAQGKLFSDDE